MKLLVLQHVAVEHPGVFRDFLKADGVQVETVQLGDGEKIPDLDPYDMMLVMGGPQDVWQEAEHPWLVDEKLAIHRFVVNMGRPYLGICLGHQLLAAAVGGNVELGQKAEVGVMPVQLTTAGKTDPLFAGLPDPLTVLQWHSAVVTSLPDRAEVLASSAACAVQAFRYGPYAYGLQCHVEITDQTVPEWAAIPEYAASLEKLLGAGASAELDRVVRQQLPGFTGNAEKLYRNFMKIIAPAMAPKAAYV